jgi:RNA polymerase sigma-70 factor, ECF subfamily
MIVSDETSLDLARVYEAYHDRVFAYVASLIGRDEADDVAQDVFVKIGRSLGTLEDRAKLTSWIYAITINTVRDRARTLSTRTDRPSGVPGFAREEREGDEPLSRVPDGTSRTPEEIAIRNEMVACYLDYVKQLPPDYYEVYVLREFESLSNEDIARRLALNVGTVKIRLHRARTELNEVLRRNCRCYHNERGELMAEPNSR